MNLTREQFDAVSARYNNIRLDNQIKLNGRIEQVYSEAPSIKEFDEEISELAAAAAREALKGNTALKDTLREDIAIVTEKKRSALLSYGFDGNYLDPIYNCQLCHDTGFVDGSPCACLNSILTEVIYTKANLADILEAENFDNFCFDYYSDDFIDRTEGISSLENIEETVDYCHKFISNFDRIHDNILFYGNAGTGKTFLINCIAKELIEKSYSVIYMSAVQFFELLASYSFKKNTTPAYGNITQDDITSCDLLIIDDLGTEIKNSFTTSAMFDCINERLIHRKSIIISTNYSLKDLKTEYDERIVSRIAGNFNMMKIFGEDIRTLKKQQ